MYRARPYSYHHTYPNDNTDEDSYPHAYYHAHPDRDSDIDSDRDAGAADEHADDNAYTYKHPDPDTDSNADDNAYTSTVVADVSAESATYGTESLRRTLHTGSGVELSSHGCDRFLARDRYGRESVRRLAG